MRLDPDYGWTNVIEYGTPPTLGLGSVLLHIISPHFSTELTSRWWFLTFTGYHTVREKNKGGNRWSTTSPIRTLTPFFMKVSMWESSDGGQSRGGAPSALSPWRARWPPQSWSCWSWSGSRSPRQPPWPVICIIYIYREREWSLERAGPE